MIPLVLNFFAPFAYDQYTLSKVALAAVLVCLAGWRRGFQIKPLTTPLLLMFGAVCLSALASGDVPVNVAGRYMTRYFGVVPLAVCWLAYHISAGYDIPKQMRWAAALMSVYGLSQLAWSPLGYDVLSTGSRIIGPMGSPPALGCALAMCLPFCLPRVPLSALVVLAIFATGSRGPLLAAIVVVAIHERRRSLDAYRAAVFTLIFALTCFATVFLFHHGTSDVIRLLTWKTSLQIWWANPIFGCGSESYVDAWRAFRSPEWVRLVGGATFQDHAHNDFLMMLASFGLVGFAAYGYLLWKTLGLFRIVTARRAEFASVIAVFVCAKFNAVPFAVLFGLALLLGSLSVSETPKAPGIPRFTATLLAIFGLVTFSADIVFYRSRRVLDLVGIERASLLNPSELFYQAHHADLLTRRWNYEVGQGRISDELALRALAIGRAALATHPVSVQARHIVTQNLILLAQMHLRWGETAYLEEARDSAEKLFALDPQTNYRFKIVVK